ncbi:MAG: class I SAM-dependent methyltransferase, partial [Deltaproteobacteria bacterium]|nr:class I SAM-dependent methyltransferase [Deltaproteobacteria bacterium]
SIEALPFADASFDAVVSLDVICLDGVDERRALAELRRVLRPGGLLILNLPAFESLRGEHDRAVRIRHRFRTGETSRLLQGNGFVPRRVRYWNTLLFPAVWLVRRFRSHGESTSDLAPLPGPLNLALRLVLGIEATLFALVPAPVGSSVLAVARRR